MWVQTLALPLISCAILDKLVNSSEHLDPINKAGMITAHTSKGCHEAEMEKGG